MTMTRRGVYHNLNDSKYATSNSEVALFFSSRFYLGKFMREYKEHRKVFRERMARAIEVDEMNTDLLADVNLYKNIEKRGFRSFLFEEETTVKGYAEITLERGELDWEELHLFALVRMTEKNTLDWSETSEQKLEGLTKITV